MKYIFDGIRIILFAGFFTVFIHYFFIQTYVVVDDGMMPAFEKGDVLLVNRLAYFLNTFQREDLIVFRDQENISKKSLRRIIALPFERATVSDGILRIQDTQESLITELPLFGSTVLSITDKGYMDENEYFVMTDSRPSLPVGMIDEKYIIGKPIIRLWPYKRIKFLY